MLDAEQSLNASSGPGALTRATGRQFSIDRTDITQQTPEVPGQSDRFSPRYRERIDRAALLIDVGRMFLDDRAETSDPCRFGRDPVP